MDSLPLKVVALIADYLDPHGLPGLVGKECTSLDAAFPPKVVCACRRSPLYFGFGFNATAYAIAQSVKEKQVLELVEKVVSCINQSQSFFWTKQLVATPLFSLQLSRQIQKLDKVSAAFIKICNGTVN